MIKQSATAVINGFVRESASSVLIMAMRGASLVIKFVLLIVMGRFLELSSIGAYGVLVGASLIYSQVAGWGFGFNISRYMITTKEQERQTLLARQWGVFFYTYLLTGLLFWGLSGAVPHGDASNALTSWTFLGIIIGEHASQELSRLLISDKHEVKGNILLFIRTAGWAIPIAVALFVIPAVRNIRDVFWVWAIGEAASALLGIWWCRIYVVNWHDFLRSCVCVPISWLKEHTKASLMLYTAFSISVILSYLNRFSTGLFLSLNDTGLYTLYWSIISSIYALALTGFIQTAYPRMIACRMDRGRFHKKVLALYRQSIVFSLVSALFIGACAPKLFLLMHKHQAIDHLPVFYLMLLGGIVKLLGSVAFYVLYAQYDDRALMKGTLAVLAVSLPASASLVAFLHLWGAAISDCFSAGVLFVILVTAYLLKRRSGCAVASIPISEHADVCTE